MAYSMNRVTLLGNVGRNPEVRSLSTGSRVVNLSLATSEQWKDRNGEKQEKTEWHRVTIWPEALVDLVERSVRKGHKLYIEGQLETRKWTDQSGQDRYSTEVVVKGFDGKIILLERQEGNGSGRRDDRDDDRHSGGGGGSYPAANRMQSPDGNGYSPPQRRSSRDDLDDEIPF